MSDAMRATYELVVDELAADGVSVVFGLMAEDTAVLTSELERAGIRYQPAKHENVAVAMADGYAWASGELGAVILGRGPGLANGATGLAAAVRGRRRLLVLSTVSLTESGPWNGDLKAIDQQAFATALGLHYIVPAGADDVGYSFRRALKLAHAGQPALFVLPLELIPTLAVVPDAADPPVQSPPVEPSAADLDRLLELFAAARRPLVLAGSGAVHAREQLIALAQRTGAVLGTTLLAKDLFRGHPLDLRVIGGFATETARELLAQVDTVFAFGASVNIYTRAHGTIFPHATIVAIDNDATHLGQFGPIDAGFAADARLTAEHLLTKLPERAPHERPFHDPHTLARIADPQIWDRDDQHTTEYVDPRALSQLLDEILPQNRQLITDAGAYTVFPATSIRVPHAGMFRQTGEFVAVGMGIGAATGAAIARPDTHTILAIGDGGLAMTLGDLEPLKRLHQPIIVIVYNDQAYGAERHFLDLDGRSNKLALVPDIDFAAIAQAMGIHGTTIHTLNDLQNLKTTLAKPTTPILIDCKINPTVRARYVDDVNELLPKRVASTAAATA